MNTAHWLEEVLRPRWFLAVIPSGWGDFAWLNAAEKICLLNLGSTSNVRIISRLQGVALIAVRMPSISLLGASAAVIYNGRYISGALWVHRSDDVVWIESLPLPKSLTCEEEELQ